MRKISLLLWVLFFSGVATAQDLLKIAFYNLFEYPNYTPTNRAPILKSILSEIDPDLFLVCELLTEEAADDILYHVLDYNPKRQYNRASFIPNSTEVSNLQQLLYYDSNIWELLSTQNLPTSYRDINKYKLELRTYDYSLDPVYLYVFIAHLKSSQGLANRKIRLEMVEKLLSHLETLEPDALILFAGDLNLYTYKEEAYQALLNKQNHVVIKDPIDSPGVWNKNEDFAQIHTQSTRKHFSEFGAGAGGGMDDRFDFILLSDNFFNNDSELQYIADSYLAFGNNGNCFRMSINDPDCNGAYSQYLRNLLYRMSDHLPVVLELKTKRKLLNVPNYTKSLNFPILRLNPVNDFLLIQLPEISKHDLGKTNFQIKIFDPLGRVVFTKEYPKTHTQLKIEIEQLAKGMYFIQFSNYLGHSIKFIKI